MKEKEERPKKRNKIYSKIKNLKPEVKFLLTIVTLLFVGYFANGYIESYNEKQRIIRLEEDRMVEYTLENFEDIRKIEFTSFEQNFSTGMWAFYATINENIYVRYRLNGSMGENNEISIEYRVADSEGREPKEKKENSRDKKTEDIEVIYKKG